MRRVLRAGAALLLCSAAAVPLAVGPARAAEVPSTFDTTETLTRTFVVGGKDVPVDTRTVSLHVSRTNGLRDRDGINVSWSGAHPTGGFYPDVHSPDATKDEYPMVLLECRGVDDPSAPAAQQLSPQTCFTQSPVERYAEELNTEWPEWRMDRYAQGPDLSLQANLPAGKTTCPAVLPYDAVHNVPFVAVSGTTYPMAQGGCAGMPPEMSALATSGLPSNSTYAVTQPDGQGSARFDVRTSDSNASLGCSQKVPCALVAVPIMGISCNEDFSNLPADDRPTDPDEITYDLGHCTATGAFAPGAPATSPKQQRAVTGALWWSASNWRGRVTVPLSFAPPGNICDVVGSGAPLYFYGSELMIQALSSWSPHFCLDKDLFPVKHIQTGEPQARSLLKHGTIAAALSSDQPDGGYPDPVVQAPVAMTGFTIGFAVDDKRGLPASQLNLTPRLLAKLLTESYPALPDIRRSYAGLSHNPLNLLADPEFQALNPTLPTGLATVPSSTLFALSSDSDVMQALTAYIQADADARAWLDGAPDPWGMVVNPSYKGIALPVNSWPLLDTFELNPAPNLCLQQDPAPYLNLVAAPTQRIPTISLDLQYAISPSVGDCVVTESTTGLGNKLGTIGPEASGHRFLLGVTSLGDAERFGLGEASLLSHTDPGAAQSFTDTAGRTFVAPTSASLAAAARLMTADPKTGSWQVDATVLRTATAGAAAYPGAMLVDAVIPTSGLPTPEASRYASFLSWAATSGQVPGTGVGQLPAGYLPLTTANGLAAQVSYTQRAATAVAAQRGALVPLVVQSPAPTASHSPTGSPGQGGMLPGASGSPTARQAPGVPADGSGPVIATGSDRTTASSGVTPHLAPVVAAASLGRTPGSLLGDAAAVLPFLVLASIIAGVAALPGLLVRRDGTS